MRRMRMDAQSSITTKPSQRNALWWRSEGRKALGLDEHKAGPYGVGDACGEFT